MMQRSAPWVLIALGLLDILWGYHAWSPCFVSNDLACREALNERPEEPLSLAVWILSFASITLTMLFRTGRVGTFIGLILIAIANPLVDPGFFWRDWNSADGAAGTGMTAGAVIVVSGVIVRIFISIDRRRVAGGLLPLGEGGS
jgi:hypothetical protein